MKKSLLAATAALASVPASAGTLIVNTRLFYGYNIACVARADCDYTYYRNLSDLQSLSGEGAFSDFGSRVFVRPDDRTFTATFVEGKFNTGFYRYGTPDLGESFSSSKGSTYNAFYEYAYDDLGRYQRNLTVFYGRFAGASYDGRPLDLFVPEPTTWALLVLGFGAVGAGMRRRGQAVVRLGSGAAT